MDNAKKVFDYILNKFFGNYLSLRKNDQIKTTKPPELNKAYLHHLKAYYQITNQDSDDEDR
jgi:hypothetical protein